MESGTVIEYDAVHRMGTVSSDADDTHYLFSYRLSEPLAVDDAVTFAIARFDGGPEAVDVCKQVLPTETGTVIQYSASKRLGIVLQVQGRSYYFRYRLSEPLAVRDEVTFVVMDFPDGPEATHVRPV